MSSQTYRSLRIFRPFQSWRWTEVGVGVEAGNKRECDRYTAKSCHSVVSSLIQQSFQPSRSYTNICTLSRLFYLCVRCVVFVCVCVANLSLLINVNKLIRIIEMRSTVADPVTRPVRQFHFVCCKMQTQPWPAIMRWFVLHAFAAWHSA